MIEAFKKELYKDFDYKHKDIIDAFVEQGIREGVRDSAIIFEWVENEVGYFENEN